MVAKENHQVMDDSHGDMSCPEPINLPVYIYNPYPSGYPAGTDQGAESGPPCKSQRLIPNTNTHTDAEPKDGGFSHEAKICKSSNPYEHDEYAESLSPQPSAFSIKARKSRSMFQMPTTRQTYFGDSYQTHAWKPAPDTNTLIAKICINENRT